MKEYTVTDLWVSEELAHILIRDHGCSMLNHLSSISDLVPNAYLWNVPTNFIRMYRNVDSDIEDSLAKQLLLINCVETRLEYLNS